MQRTYLVVIALLTLVSLGLNIYYFFSLPKLAYVRSNELIENYSGTREARDEFNRKKTAMLANVDSLRTLFERSKIDYMGKSRSMTQAQRNAREAELTYQENQLIQYRGVVEEKINEDDARMMGAVLSQINSFVEEYAEENDMDIVLGTTMAGSLLYGKKAMDITDPLLEALNDKYKGK
jgi:outer membrane protein